MNIEKISGDGMIHGRFQPFTIGHMQHLKRAFSRVQRGNKLYIGITKPFSTDSGISEGDDHRDNKNSNPYTFEQRREMIYTSIEMDPIIQDRLDDVIIIPWSMNNTEDLDKIIDFFMPDKSVVQFMNIIPNDGWEYEKQRLLQNRGFITVNLVNPSRPRITSATEVRKKYKSKSKDWTDIVPEGTEHILRLLEENPEIIKQEYTSIDEFLNECKKLTTKESIANAVLPRTPYQQEKVDEASVKMQDLIEEKGDNSINGK